MKPSLIFLGPPWPLFESPPEGANLSSPLLSSVIYPVSHTHTHTHAHTHTHTHTQGHI